MRGKRKFILLILFLFGFKKADKRMNLIYGEPVALKEGSVLFSEGYLLKVEKDFYDSLKNLNIPYLYALDVSPDSYKINSLLYPAAEFLYKVKTEYPELYHEIKKIDAENLEIFTKDNREIKIGLGRWDRKIKVILKEKNKKTIDLTLISFLEGGTK